MFAADAVFMATASLSALVFKVANDVVNAEKSIAGTSPLACGAARCLVGSAAKLKALLCTS